MHATLALDTRDQPAFRAPAARLAGSGSPSPDNLELRTALRGLAGQLGAIGATIVWHFASGLPDIHACLGLDADNDRFVRSTSASDDPAHAETTRRGFARDGSDRRAHASRAGDAGQGGNRAFRASEATPYADVDPGMHRRRRTDDARGSAVHGQAVVHHGQPHLLLQLRTAIDGDRVAVDVLVAGGDLARARSDMAAVLPMFEACLASWVRSERLVTHVQTLETALDCTAFGQILLDEDRSFLSVNRSAEDLLAARDGIRRIGPSVGGETLNDTLRLQSAIDHALTDAAHADGALVAMKRGGGKRPLLISVSARVGNAFDRDRIAVLHIVDPDRNWAPFLQQVCRHFGLSPVETSLAVLLTLGHSLADAAKSMRVQQATARSYLKQIFLKTDINRQSELVGILLRSCMPMAGARPDLARPPK